MGLPSLKIVILGLSITSSWGNGHATTYRGLIRELVEKGHDVLFLERDVPWYASNRDMPNPPFGRTELYSSIEELQESFAQEVQDADFVMVGSYVPDGVTVGEWVVRTARGVTAFYDIDTPVTLAHVELGDSQYLSRTLIPRFNLYLSFTGGPTLERLQKRYGAQLAKALYCSVDPSIYYPEEQEKKWDLGYLGTYSDDRQPPLDRLLLEPARRWSEGRFVVAGPQYPDSVRWPENVERIEHIPPDRHRAFYNSQKFTLNITRANMIRAGYSPSVRLFEAAACGTPIISDYWDGLETFFVPGEEIFISQSPEDTLKIMRETTDEERITMSERARACVLANHTAAHRAQELEEYISEVMEHFGVSGEESLR